jgi:hypothetical protein
MYSARNCTEKALKAFLCFHEKVTANEAKSRFGHKLDKLIAEIARLHPTSQLRTMAGQLDAFAPYADRYSGRVFSRAELWRAYRLAQFAAGEVMRSVTGRNQRASVQEFIAGIVG